MVPVVFFHRGTQEYLQYVIRKVESYGDYTYLIGDKSNQGVCKNWVDQSELIGDFTIFKQVYKHMSSNSKDFELSCFQRYFALYELMKKKNLKRVLMLDSDVLVTMSLGSLNIWDSEEIAFSVPTMQDKYDWVASPHVFYCTINALSEFIEFLIDTYTKNIGQLEEKYKHHCEKMIKGGICDMTLLYLWSKKVKYINLYSVKEFYFDHTMQEKGVFKWDKVLHMKKLLINNDSIYLLENTGKIIKPATLHFQGSTKSIIIDVIKRQPRYVMLLDRYVDLILKIKSKILSC